VYSVLEENKNLLITIFLRKMFIIIKGYLTESGKNLELRAKNDERYWQKEKRVQLGG
jgi:hypothetical protein